MCGRLLFGFIFFLEMFYRIVVDNKKSGCYNYD